MANIDDLRTLAQQIKNETTVGANTANRVGTTFEKTVTELETIEGNVDAEATARQQADDAEIRNRQNADNEIKNLIRGVSDNSSAYKDPFLKLSGTYNNVDELDAALTEILKISRDGDDVSNMAKYAGTLHASVSGCMIDVRNFILSWTNRDWVQIISGPLVLNDLGKLRLNNKSYNTFFRTAHDGEIGAWQQFYVTQGDILAEQQARQNADGQLQQAINLKQDTLTFDDTPTSGSTNPVKSSGVKAADEAVRRSFYEAAGAVYNATTGYYELNGLTDITEAQMAEIYAIGRGFNFGKDNDYKFAYQRLRTNLLPITSNASNCGVYTAYNANNAVSCRCMFAYTSTFEVVVVGIGKTGSEMGFYPLDASLMFANCSNLRTVLGFIKMNYCDSVSGMFTGCSSLRTVKLSALKINISFADSPLLYYTSLKYLIDNAANTAAITVTVHADVYAKLTRTYEGSVMGKIQEEANETGQDVTTLAQSWASLSSTAANKNISFAEP